ncbi:hypothetical protein TNCV_3808781 [Trichonephila clavipes]|nr:hypothetical protein TNCV_3808781 [Trichonephila clavipes]
MDLVSNFFSILLPNDLLEEGVTIGPVENHDMFAHIITCPTPCLTVGRRKSRSNACAEDAKRSILNAKNLRLMVTKCEETGSLNVRSGRGRKPVSTEAIEKVALQVEEDKASNVQASTSVAEALDLPHSTVQKIM